MKNNKITDSRYSDNYKNYNDAEIKKFTRVNDGSLNNEMPTNASKYDTTNYSSDIDLVTR